MKSATKVQKKPQLRTVIARLEWVRDQILAEPKLYDQNAYTADVVGDYCNSVGCIAGWLDVRVNGMKKHLLHTPLQAKLAGLRALGLDMGNHVPKLFGTCVFPKPGTKAAARVAEKKINEAIKYLRQGGSVWDI